MAETPEIKYFIGALRLKISIYTKNIIHVDSHRIMKKINSKQSIKHNNSREKHVNY